MPCSTALKKEVDEVFKNGYRTVQDVKFRIPTCKGRPRGNNDVTDCSKWGLTYDQFLHFLATCKSTKKWKELKRSGVPSGRKFVRPHPKTGHEIPRGGYVSAHDLVANFVKPLTKGTGCGLGLLLNHSPRPCDMMLSHSWNEDMEEVEDALKAYFKLKKLPGSTMVWFCCFALYQPAGDDDDSGPTVGKQCTIKPPPFAQAIKAAARKDQMVSIHTNTHVISPVDPHADGVDNMYNRLWCVYEMHYAFAEAKCKNFIACSDRYLKYLMETGEAHRYGDVHVKTKDAFCSDDNDKKFIHSKMHSSDFSHLDTRINTLRKNMASAYMFLPVRPASKATSSDRRKALQAWRKAGAGGGKWFDKVYTNTPTSNASAASSNRRTTQKAPAKHGHGGVKKAPAAHGHGGVKKAPATRGHGGVKKAPAKKTVKKAPAKKTVKKKRK